MKPLTGPWILALAVSAVLLAAGIAGAQDKGPSFFRKKLKSDEMETVWVNFKPGRQAIFDYMVPILAKQGVAKDKDYFLDRDDGIGLLAVTGKTKAVELVLQAIAALYTENPQVKVSVQIAETLTFGDTQSGIEAKWDRKTSETTFFRGFEVNNKPQGYLDNLLSSSLPFQGTTAEFGTVDSKGNILDQAQYNRVGAIYLAIRAIQEYQNTEILAKPAVMVDNGVQATIVSGSTYPYQKVTYSGTTAIISTEPIKIGVTMKVTPYVIGKSKIRMKLDILVENVVGFVEIAQGAKNPFTDQRQVIDTLTIDNGATVSIGGLYQSEQTLVEKGVPVLMDIPILGLLFKSYWNQVQKKELLFFITPKIVTRTDRFYFPTKPETGGDEGGGGGR